MKNLFLTFLLAAGAVLVPGSAAAAEEARTWTSASGTRLTAELTAINGGQVVLKTAEGRVVTLRRDQLSKEDQEHLADLEKKKPAEDGAADKATTVMDPDAWYARGLQDRDIFLMEFLLKAGESRDFEAPADGKKQCYVGFSAEKGRELRETYEKKDEDSPYSIQLISRSHKIEALSSHNGGGMSWSAKSGKVRFTIKNHGEIDTRVVIKMRKDK